MLRYTLLLSSGQRVDHESDELLGIDSIVDLGELGRWRVAAAQAFPEDALPDGIEAVFVCSPAT